MATINIMAEDTPASELEEDQELLIEALRRHLTYVESRLAEIAEQMQGAPSPEAAAVHGRGGKKKEAAHARPTAVEESVPYKPKLPRASELTRLPRKVKPVLSDKEKEKLQRVAAARKRQTMEHLSMLTALERLKSDYRDRYLELMQQQVRDQQRRVREKDAEWEKKLALQEERVKKQRLQRKPHAFRSSAVADYSFLDNVHQGLFYKIVSLEMELRKKGVLRSLQDLQTFWEHMLSQENDTESLVAVDSAASRAHIRQRHVAESPVLEEDEEESSHSWAITAVPRTDKGTATSNRTTPQTTQSNQSLQFQPAKPPQFESVHQLLHSSSQEEKQEAQRHTARVHALQKKTRMVEHMFDLARANEQVTARLLEHLDIGLTFDMLPPPLECLPLPSSPSPSTMTMTVLSPTSEHRVGGKEMEDANVEQKEKVEEEREAVPAELLGAVVLPTVEYDCVSSRDNCDKAGTTALEALVADKSGSSSTLDLASPTSEGTEQPATPTPTPPPPPLPCIPLTMESLMVGEEVKASKSTSLWTNYLLAGK